jgi:hypothetical protein
MSNALGAVRFQNGKVMFYEYGGTADVCSPTLRETPELVSQFWRQRGPGKSWDDIKACTHAEDVTIWSGYGGGFYWPGKACQTCALITDNHNPYEDDHIAGPAWRNDGEPEWVKEALQKS